LRVPRFLDLGWHDDRDLLGEIVGHIRAGGLVAMPTETVYGFGCLPGGDPLRELQRIKARGPENPFLLLIPDPGTVTELEWIPDAEELVEVFWPGALTLVLNDPGGRFPAGVRNSQGGVGIRVSPHPMARALVKALDGPIVSTSANVPGGSPALSAREAMEAVKALNPRAPFWVLDGGPLRPSPSSTVVDCTGDAPVVRRVGAIPVERLRCVLPGLTEET
jgi:L-threonylcarbamoyladenylate synthase